MITVFRKFRISWGITINDIFFTLSGFIDCAVGKHQLKNPFLLCHQEYIARMGKCCIFLLVTFLITSFVSINSTSIQFNFRPEFCHSMFLRLHYSHYIIVSFNSTSIQVQARILVFYVYETALQSLHCSKYQFNFNSIQPQARIL